MNAELRMQNAECWMLLQVITQLLQSNCNYKLSTINYKLFGIL